MPTLRAHHPDPCLYAILRTIARILVRLLTRIKIYGLENLPAHGPYIVMVNHLSAIDPPLILVLIPKPVTVFAAHTHRHEFIIGQVMNALGAIWVRRGEVDREALSAALDVLKDGGIIGVAPEGTRSKTGALQKGKVGTAYLALRSGVPLVPVTFAGTEVGLPALLRLGRPHITVTIGPPFHLPDSNRQAGRQQLQECTEMIMRTLARMLPEKYRGVYGDSG